MTEKEVKILVNEITDLGETISEAIKSLIEKEPKEEKNVIQQSLEKLNNTVSKFKQVDLKPVVDIASDISKQNISILDLVGRLIHSQDNAILIKMVLEMVEKNNSFIDRGLKQTDYSDSLNLIATKLGKDEPMIDNFKIVRRDGLIETISVNYKK